MKNDSKGLGFVKGLKKEMAQVKWPSSKEMVKYTVATLVFVIFFGGYFYLINFLFALLKELFN